MDLGAGVFHGVVPAVHPAEAFLVGARRVPLPERVGHHVPACARRDRNQSDAGEKKNIPRGERVVGDAADQGYLVCLCMSSRLFSPPAASRGGTLGCCCCFGWSMPTPWSPGTGALPAGVEETLLPRATPAAGTTKPGAATPPLLVVPPIRPSANPSAVLLLLLAAARNV